MNANEAFLAGMKNHAPDRLIEDTRNPPSKLNVFCFTRERLARARVETRSKLERYRFLWIELVSPERRLLANVKTKKKERKIIFTRRWFFRRYVSRHVNILFSFYTFGIFLSCVTEYFLDSNDVHFCFSNAPLSSTRIQHSSRACPINMRARINMNVSTNIKTIDNVFFSSRNL